MPFGTEIRVALRNHVLHGGRDLPTVRVNYWGFSRQFKSIVAFAAVLQQNRSFSTPGSAPGKRKLCSENIFPSTANIARQHAVAVDVMNIKESGTRSLFACVRKIALDWTG